jgi:hypothetical protein
MQAPPAVFSQINAALYPGEFARCLELFPDRRPPRGLTAYDHFLALCFGQLTYRESLRDVVGCLNQIALALSFGFLLAFHARRNWALSTEQVLPFSFVTIAKHRLGMSLRSTARPQQSGSS